MGQKAQSVDWRCKEMAVALRPPALHHAGMMGFRLQFQLGSAWMRTVLVAAAATLLGGCDNDPVGNEFGVELVEPLAVDLVESVHRVHARANIRVDWRVEFSNLSRGCVVPTRTVCDFWDDQVLQDEMSFPWSPHPLFPGEPAAFFVGDSVLARVFTVPPVKASQEPRARVIFVFGRPPTPTVLLPWKIP